jgi:hypothetical protein
MKVIIVSSLSRQGWRCCLCLISTPQSLFVSVNSQDGVYAVLSVWYSTEIFHVANSACKWYRIHCSCKAYPIETLHFDAHATKRMKPPITFSVQCNASGLLYCTFGFKITRNGLVFVVATGEWNQGQNTDYIVGVLGGLRRYQHPFQEAIRDITLICYVGFLTNAFQFIDHQSFCCRPHAVRYTDSVL